MFLWEARSQIRKIIVPYQLYRLLHKSLKNVFITNLSTTLKSIKLSFNIQFGFRKGHSTAQAITEITNTPRKAVDNNLYTRGVFPDFSKAFDTVNHTILLSKLEAYGIRGNVVGPSQGSWFFQRMTKATPGDEVVTLPSKRMERQTTPFIAGQTSLHKSLSPQKEKSRIVIKKQ